MACSHRQSKTERLLMRLLAAWMMAVGLASLLSPYGQTGGNVATIVVFTVVCVVFLSTAAHLWKNSRADTYLLFLSALFAATVHASELKNAYFAFAATALLIGLGWLLCANGRLPTVLPQISERTMRTVVAVLAGALFLFLAVLTTLRYLCYYSPNFDFGLYSNMFYHMRTDLTQTVSCERDMLISHFDVHISPIYYLFLPFYALIPSPITLQVLQAAMVAGGVVPLVMLAKRRGLAPIAVTVVAAMYLLYPAFAGGCFYDLHENKILPLLILSMVCAYEKKRYGWMYFFAALTLLVKEDAPIYVAVFGLYLLLGRKEWRRGSILAGVAVGYFLLAVAMLEYFGLGLMTWRYANLSESGLLGVVWAVLLNPAGVLAQCLTAEKLVFLLQMLLPLLFLPLATKRPGRWILLIPLVLVHLMTGYDNQYSIDYQYTYGSGSLLFYAAVLNSGDLRERTAAMSLMGAAVASIVAFAAFTWPRTGIAVTYANSAETRAAVAAVLAEVPEDAEVTADTFLIAHLADRDVIYQYPSQNETEYIVLDLRFVEREKLAETEQTLADRGYVCVVKRDGAAAIYQQTETGVTP